MFKVTNEFGEFEAATEKQALAAARKAKKAGEKLRQKFNDAVNLAADKAAARAFYVVGQLVRYGHGYPVAIAPDQADAFAYLARVEDTSEQPSTDGQGRPRMHVLRDVIGTETGQEVAFCHYGNELKALLLNSAGQTIGAVLKEYDNDLPAYVVFIEAAPTAVLPDGTAGYAHHELPFVRADLTAAPAGRDRHPLRFDAAAVVAEREAYERRAAEREVMLRLRVR